MEVKPGCKTTQIASTDGWREVQLAWCVQLGAPICYGILMPGEHCRSGVPVVKVRDMINGKIQETSLLYTHPSIDNAYKRSKLNQRDVLISIRGTTGRVALVSASLDGANITQDTARVRIKDKIDAQFVYYALQSELVQQQVALHTIGQAVKGINIRDVRELALALPDSLSEQRAIAAALSDVDALLDGLDRLIAKKRDLKQAAMQQLLTGQTRLPGFSGEWDQVKLDELFSFKNGLNKAKEFFGYGTPIVNYMDVFASSAIYPSKLDGRVSLSNAELKNFDVKKGDVFFTRTSETIEEVGIAAVMLDDPIETVFSGFVLRARPLNERLNDEYKAYCFRSDFVRKQITSKASYTTRALTNGRILSEVILPLPSLVEQTAIAAILSDMDAEIAALKARRDKTRALKQGMMQELLTGRIRLVDPSIPKLSEGEPDASTATGH